MKYKLIIAEKPSVAAAYAAALGVKEKKDGYFEGCGYLISWCMGHLVELAEPAAYDEKYGEWNVEDLPILPGRWRYAVVKGRKKQFETLKSLMRRDDVGELVNACDAGREGELIFRLVCSQAGCTKPALRLWLSSMEDSAIRSGFAALRPETDFDALYEAALCRGRADWLVGLNATRLFTCLYHRKLTVGRVQTPTLKMLVMRDAEIAAFRKETFYRVRLTLAGAEAVGPKLPSAAEAERLRDACSDGEAVCESVTRETKTEAPPKLFDLTALQREANRVFGYTAQRTLDLAQTLYEKRLLTYPRTDSRFLTDDMGGTAEKIAALLVEKLPFMAGTVLTPDVSRLLDSRKVSDHHAIIPTVEIERADIAALPGEERNILFLVSVRLLTATAESRVYESVKAVFRCAGEEFTATGKTELRSGWRNIEARWRAALKIEPDGGAGDEEALLPEFYEGQVFSRPAARVKAQDTTPPKPYTEATLLAAMERAGRPETDAGNEFAAAGRQGLGTPATRAGIIENLVKNGYAERRGRSLIPTEIGKTLVSIPPEYLTSPELTAEWENTLAEIAAGRAEPSTFMRDIENTVRTLVRENRTAEKEKASLLPNDRPSIGTCPRCGKPVYAGKKNYCCSDRDCGFVMWKNDRFFEDHKTVFTPKIAAALLKDGKAAVKGMYSPKSGKNFDADIVLADTGGKYVNYRLAFPPKTKGAR